VAVAIASRVAFVSTQPDYRPFGDAADYNAHAVFIASGDGFPPTAIAAPGTPSALRPPAYPFALGAVYAPSGNSVTAGRLLGAALGTLSALLTYLLAGGLFSRRVGVVGGVLCALFPPLVVLSGTLLSENLFIPLALAAVLVVLRARASAHHLWWAVAAGVMCGLAALTRAAGLVLVVPAVVGLVTIRPLKRGALASGVAVACMLLVLLPWAVRNAHDFHRFVPVSTQFGFTAAGAYNSVAFHSGPVQAAWQVPCDVPDYSMRCHRPGIDEARLDASLRRSASHFARAHPGYVLTVLRLDALRSVYLGGNPAFTRLWDRELGLPHSLRGLVKASVLTALALAVLGVISLLAGWARGGRPLFVWLAPALLLAATLPMLGNPRYRIAIDPFLLTLAAVALTTATRWLKPGRASG
jgi:4-amino-4-deoxy-L-arabinose transferase-like glycosyltransferase